MDDEEKEQNGEGEHAGDARSDPIDWGVLGMDLADFEHALSRLRDGLAWIQHSLPGPRPDLRALFQDRVDQTAQLKLRIDEVWEDSILPRLIKAKGGPVPPNPLFGL
jgi:hypothetical protein